MNEPSNPDSVRNPSHPAYEPPRQIFLHGILPALVAVALVMLSVILDLCAMSGWFAGRHWTQRSGSVMAVLGVYVALIDARRSSKVIPLTADGVSLYINPFLPYKAISIALAAIGTVVWGYADLWL